jgi:hypothetical protein
MLGGVRAAAIGWTCGFAVAELWNAVGGGDHQLGVALLPWGIGGLVVMAGLLALSGIRRAVIHQLGLREARRDAAWFARMLPAGPHGVGLSSLAGGGVATAAAAAGAARIALLEARLAQEQEALDAAMQAMAEQEAAAERPAQRLVVGGPVENPAVAEPALRQELVNAMVELMGRRKPDGQQAQSIASLLDRAG